MIEQVGSIILIMAVLFAVVTVIVVYMEQVKYNKKHKNEEEI